MFDINNKNAIDESFEREALVHMNLVYNMAYHMVGNSQDAEDLVQETFLKAYKFFDKYKKDTNCKAWLIRILRNTYINQYRKVIKEPVKVDFEDIQPLLTDKEQTDKSHVPSELGLMEGLDDKVEAAISKLPEEYKTAVLLADIEEFSYEEISRIMGCPVGTVRSRISRGRAILRKDLIEYAKEKHYAGGMPV